MLTHLARSLFVAIVLVIGLSSTGQAADHSPKHAPEIDPASATAALVMLAGGVLMIRARRR